MTSRLKIEKLILYVLISAIYLAFWIHTDLVKFPGKFSVSLVNNLWQTAFVVGINLLYFEYALPFAIAGRINRLLAIILSLLFHLLIFIVGLYAWRMLGSYINIYEPFKPFTDTRRHIEAIIVFTPGAFLLFAVFKLFFDYTQLKYEGQQMRLEKKNAELLFLRSQINPHFLFNTLNNIYSLSQYHPLLVSESVLRLSKILRYILYETGNELIPVDKELKIISDYIDLEKLRYSEKVSIRFDHQVDDLSAMMPPLLLLPLVENAFKHGVAEARGERFVHATFTLKKGRLEFTVTNSCDPAPGKQEIKGNIGLSNLRRRLNLLYKNYDLYLVPEEKMFTAILNIDLLSHV